MKITSLAAALLLSTLFACDAEDAGTDADDAAPAADAPSTPAGPAMDDVAALRDYELSMERLDRFFEAQLSMARVASRMTPEERAALEQPNNEASNASLDDMVAHIERNPALRQALDEADISARDYAMTMVAMMQASMAMGILQMRPNDDPDSLMREMNTNPANVRFIQENMDEITRRQEAASAEMRRLFPDEQQ